jgi:DNA-binding MarR family transcriptional regulator
MIDRPDDTAGEPEQPETRAGTWPPPTSVADLRAPAVQALLRIARRNRWLLRDSLRRLGLLGGEEFLVVQLGELDGCTHAELADSLRLGHSNVAKMVGRLRAAGLVERRPSERARRGGMLYLTPAGRDLRYRIEEMWQEMELSTVGHLSPSERGDLLALLRRVEAQSS